MNYRQMANHTGIEQKAQFSQLKQDKVGCEYYVEDQQYTQDYFKKMDIGFFVGVKPLTQLINNNDVKFYHNYRHTVDKVKDKEWVNWIEKQRIEYSLVK
ncbi:hypothetical protein PVA45_01510 [Entomospira entomophila]|uniref:Uncharacterized protein n=1 Tax=Entomospira entomophila TaxID=2719988 RepID=A0A968G8Z7_9SPIO|nr:hypothetical protein [Entomospira entomophilus]NIZ40191.1 hypothetical protein [Entomospira entomophilus]WDI35750.1 hypothetical protein PVA45_01510 [Entomospira entomophilus]